MCAADGFLPSSSTLNATDTFSISRLIVSLHNVLPFFLIDAISFCDGCGNFHAVFHILDPHPTSHRRDDLIEFLNNVRNPQGKFRLLLQLVADSIFCNLQWVIFF